MPEITRRSSTRATPRVSVGKAAPIAQTAPPSARTHPPSTLSSGELALDNICKVILLWGVWSLGHQERAGGRGDDSHRAVTRGAQTIRVVNGPEFISKALDRWAYENGVTLDLSRPGKHAFVELSNGRLCDGCLNKHWLLSLQDARPRLVPGAGTITRAVLTHRLAG